MAAAVPALAVAAFAGVQSYSHIEQLAIRAAEPLADARLLPLPRQPHRGRGRHHPGRVAAQVVSFNFVTADAGRAAAIIRQALPETVGDADTERN